jgi:glycosyltransferase involved in cell wall biosynthesis
VTDLRVLIVINGLGTGGAERSLAEMLPRLVDDGIRPLIVVMNRRQEGVESQILERYETYFLKSRRVPTKALELRRLIREYRPHLVHTTLFESNLVGRLATAGSSTPLLTSLVNTPYDKARRVDPNLHTVHLRVVRTIDRLTAPLTTHFHAITRAVKTAAVNDLGIPARRISVIPRGRNRARLGEPSRDRRRKVRLRLRIDDDRPLLITVGRQEYQKGQRYLIEAMQLVASQNERVRLLIAGREGNASGDLALMMRTDRGLGDRVSFLGHRDDVSDLLAASDIFVFPSLWEGLGGALIEAMALGLPIVVSDIPAAREVVEADGNAVLVEPGDPRALADAILRLLGDPQQRTRFAKRSKVIFAERFELERSAQRLITLYRGLAEAGRAKDRIPGDLNEDKTDTPTASLTA